MKISLEIIVASLFAVLTMSCSQTVTVASQSTSTTNDGLIAAPTKSPVIVDVERLCGSLKELRAIPYGYDESTGDPIYDGIKAAGNSAVPCLISKITDTTPMPDPGPGPVVQDFKVGDAAVFLLLMISKEEWQPETMLSAEYAKHWETEGIYAYFAYVKKPENRKHVQNWWKNWMEENP